MRGLCRNYCLSTQLHPSSTESTQPTDITAQLMGESSVFTSRQSQGSPSQAVCTAIRLAGVSEWKLFLQQTAHMMVCFVLFFFFESSAMISAATFFRCISGALSTAGRVPSRFIMFKRGRHLQNRAPRTKTMCMGKQHSRLDFTENCPFNFKDVFVYSISKLRLLGTGRKIRRDWVGHTSL